MLKKSLVILLVVCTICLIATPVFASNMMESAGNAVGGMKNGIENMAEGVGNAVAPMREGISDMANGVKDGASKIGEDVKDAVNGSENGMERSTGTDYTASRTSANADYSNRRNSTTVWTVLLIAAIAIIALVWYYGAQSTTDGRRDNF